MSFVQFLILESTMIFIAFLIFANNQKESENEKQKQTLKQKLESKKRKYFRDLK